MIHINYNILNASQDFKTLRESTGKSTQGFTLVELSIVIIIIGLLIAGIATGTSMLKQATINSVITDMQLYQTAYNNFLLRYRAVPGDFKDAFAHWGTTCADTAEACNGNGNNVLEPDWYGPEEGVKAWKHLALANMVSGVVVKRQGQKSNVHGEIGVHIPASKVRGAGYLLQGGWSSPSSTQNDGTNPWNDNITNAIFIIIPNSDNLYVLGGAALTPQDTFSIDKKIDDGTVSVFAGTQFLTGAATGRFRATDGASAQDNCATTNTADNSGVTLNNYNSAVTTVSCVAGLALN